MSPAIKVALVGAAAAPFREALAAALGGAADFTEVPESAPREAFAAALGHADAAVSASWSADFPAAPSLRLVQVPGAGIDLVDEAALPAQAALANVYEHEPAVAEYVLAALLEWRHRLAAADADFRTGSWALSSRVGAPPGPELAGSTAAVVGFGRIGRAVARRLAAFDVTVLAVNRTPVSADPSVHESFRLADLDRALGRADWVILSLALTSDTRGLIDAARLAAMRRDAVLVNVARGPVVGEAALYDALAAGRIGGAVLDVWWTYPAGPGDAPPPAAHDFAGLKTVTMTPHIAGWTRGTEQRRARAIADNLQRLRDGRPLANLVRPPRAPA